MAKATSNKRGSSSHGGAEKRAVGQGPRSKEKPTFQKSAAPQAHAPLLDDRARRDIVGVVLGVVAIALFVCVTVRPEGVVSQALAEGLSLLLGWGSFLLPFLLLGLSATVLVRTQSERLTARTGLGLGLLFVALLGLFSLFVPGAEGEPYLVFTAQNLVSHGGYVGSGIAWVLLNLFGLTISVVIMLGLVLIALIVIGFSLSGLLGNVRDFASEHRKPQDDFEETTSSSLVPRITKGGVRKHSALADAKTQVISSSSESEEELIQSKADPSKLVTRKLGAKKKAKEAPSDLNAAETIAVPPLPGPIDSEPDATKPATRMLTRKLPGRKKKADGDVPPWEEASAQNTSAFDEAEESVLVAQEPETKTKRPKIPTTAPERQEGFDLPDPAFLNVSRPTKQSRKMAETLAATAEHLAETLAEFGIAATVVDWVAGPTVTLFKVDLPAGVRVSRVTALTDDIALALASPGVRIFAPVPGTNYVGIEVPNREHQTVLLGDVLKSAPQGPLQIAIGKDVEGHSIVSDLAKMPHLLIGGTTGSGKSVAINGMIMSILMRATPAEVRLIMID
ncbi:MAG: DNA translocase FtsK 4TM domain-containing protein, partial [Coriobacteriia bacterium]|nr:DNA translocase FtsK 4TM domain-containing protein [Coriobacteriia bacterium]